MYPSSNGHWRDTHRTQDRSIQDRNGKHKTQKRDKTKHMTKERPTQDTGETPHIKRTLERHAQDTG